MDSAKSKVLTVMVLAVFCASAFAVVLSDVDSAAADEKTYRIYVEIVDEDGFVTLTDWVKFTSEPTVEAYTKAATAAFAAYGLSGISFTISSSTGGVWVVSPEPGYNATYYASNGSWAAINDGRTEYTGNEVVGIAVCNGYISTEVYEELTQAQQSKWSYVGWGGNYDYIKLLDAKTDGYPASISHHVFVEEIKSNGSVLSSKWVSFDADKSIGSYIANGNKAMKDAGLKVTFERSTYGGIWVQSSSPGYNATYYADGDKWKEIDDTTGQYIDYETNALSVSNGYIPASTYKALPDDAKKDWKSTGMTDPYAYIKLVSESTTGYKSSPSNNTTLFIIIGVVAAVVVIGAIAFFVMKKKQQ